MKDICSVVVPIYNAEKTLDRCLSSIVTQTYKNLEIILINDGSTDKSLEICKNWQEKDKRIRIICKDNGGVSSARNMGLISSLGEYISFVDSDDTIEKNMIEVLVSNMLKYNADLSIVNYKKIIKGKEYFDNASNDKKIIVYNKKEKFYIDLSIYKGFLWNKLFRKEKIENLALDENVHFCEDEMFLIDYVEKTNIYVYDERILYNYYIYENSGSSWTTWNEKKVTVLDARKKLIKKLSKYDVTVTKRYYMEYFLVLNEIYHRYKNGKKYDKEIKKIYFHILRGKEFGMAEKLNAFLRYRLYSFYYFLKKIYNKVR